MINESTKTTLSNIELIIFDWDDVFTLGATGGYYKCFHEAIVGVEIELTPDEEKKRIDAKWGSSHVEGIGELLKEHPELVKEASKLYEQHLHGTTFTDCLKIVPGSVEFLSRLSKKYTLAISTGLHPVLLRERIMPAFGIDPSLFTQIISVYDLKDSTHAKPDPFSAKKIMQTQNTEPSSTIMVGDAGNDIRMAQAAWIEGVAVLTGHLSKNQAEALGVRHIIRDVTQLETILGKF